MRVIKDADVRKNEILDAATILFAEKGADHTSVADIMTAVGIAKGGSRDCQGDTLPSF